MFLDESGVSLLPQVRRTYAPRGRTPLLRHRLNWKRASMAAALGYHATDPDRGPRLCFHLKPGSYDTTALIEVLEQLKAFHRGERVVLVWDGLSAHWSRAMRAWVAEQNWLTLERLPAYAPELNPVELLWSSLKKRELANLAGNHLADVADATEQGIHRINQSQQLPWSFLTHTGLPSTRPPHRTNENLSRRPTWRAPGVSFPRGTPSIAAPGPSSSQGGGPAVPPARVGPISRRRRPRSRVCCWPWSWRRRRRRVARRRPGPGRRSGAGRWGRFPSRHGRGSEAIDVLRAQAADGA
ncbi:transposase [Streptomyces sp. QHH-9511]|uniref:transposase n=1 Tax=Streptomyces sp. QHH-9511 TaxID=2684468 RepID=UPI001E620FD2|nr:transposase [Streptomyces sp. QHH-9511]